LEEEEEEEEEEERKRKRGAADGREREKEKELVGVVETAVGRPTVIAASRLLFSLKPCSFSAAAAAQQWYAIGRGGEEAAAGAPANILLLSPLSLQKIVELAEARLISSLLGRLRGA
jgi:hypothetical protein